MRNFESLLDDILKAIPTMAEIEALPTEEIERLRKYGNVYDNQLYLEIMKRHESASKS